MLGIRTSFQIFDTFAVLDFMDKNPTARIPEIVDYLNSYFQKKVELDLELEAEVVSTKSVSRQIRILKEVFQMKIDYSFKEGKYSITDWGIINPTEFRELMKRINEELCFSSRSL